MSSKVPYYYSELTPQERAERAAQQQHNGEINLQTSDTNANSNNQESGFFNPLLNIGMS